MFETVTSFLSQVYLLLSITVYLSVSSIMFFDQSGSYSSFYFCNSCPKSLCKIKELVLLSIFHSCLKPYLGILGAEGGGELGNIALIYFSVVLG